MGITSGQPTVPASHDSRSCGGVEEADEHYQVRWTHSLHRTGERARSILFILALAVVVIFGLLQVTVVVVPLLLALILAAAISPVVNWLRHHGWKPGWATAARECVDVARVELRIRIGNPSHLTRATAVVGSGNVDAGPRTTELSKRRPSLDQPV